MKIQNSNTLHEEQEVQEQFEAENAKCENTDVKVIQKGINIDDLIIDAD